jgi:hypothetical protein
MDDDDSVARDAGANEISDKIAAFAIMEKDTEAVRMYCIGAVEAGAGWIALYVSPAEAVTFLRALADRIEAHDEDDYWSSSH